MVRFPDRIALALAFGLGLADSSGQLAGAATSSTLDVLPDSIVTPGETIELGRMRQLQPKRDTPAPVQLGNPLWAVPLSVLTATQQRPIFSASRRPPPRAVVGAPIASEGIAVPAPALPDHPQLSLIGVVVGDGDAIAVFLDRSNQVVRLRSGQSHTGWVLRSVERREVTLKKDDQVEILALKRSDANPGPQNAPIPPGGVDLSSAPFTPRSTPKNGESDGL
jgi:general secretion pathway protein N